MNKFILSLLLLPTFLNANHLVDLTTSEKRDFQILLGQTFTITALQGYKNRTNPWRLETYAPFELLFDGWNDGCIVDRTPTVIAANTQIWTFKATQPGAYEIVFDRLYPSPMQAMDIETVLVEVY